jgi:mono/diheme cytochrome c family protein
MTRVLLSIPFLLLVLLGCSDPAPQQQEMTKPVAVVQQGQEIYMLYCASCHGQTGDGKGLVELDRPARSFVDGGFSFGNTIHAISKTTASGIPGTPMPPFVDVLTSEQMKDVSVYVRAFAPTLAEATPDETEMVVLNRPVIVRGMIPPLHEGLQLHPRGLVVGNPDRFSYEYRVDDVRLLAVRQGLFVQRADWGERGGSPLDLLGKIVVDVENGDPKGMFTTKDDIPLYAKLLSTISLGKHGIVRYSLVTPDEKIIATVEEYCSPTTGTRTLIQQHLTIDSSEEIIIHPPSNTDVSSAPFIPAGKHEFIITHALYGGDS